jgi:hypothetical protein
MTNHFLWMIEWGACAWMSGIIYLIHWIHYPGFAEIERKRFPEFCRIHGERITYIVFPAMLIELSISAILAWRLWSISALMSLTSVLALWAITGIFSAPDHAKLSDGFSQKTLNHLLYWNRFRVLLWSVRLVLIPLVWI